MSTRNRDAPQSGPSEELPNRNYSSANALSSEALSQKLLHPQRDLQSPKAGRCAEGNTSVCVRSFTLHQTLPQWYKHDPKSASASRHEAGSPYQA